MKLEYTIDKTMGIITLADPTDNTDKSPIFADRKELSDFMNTSASKGILIQCNGMDFYSCTETKQVNTIKAEKKITPKILQQTKILINEIAYATIPVIAVIQGNCLGVGLQIAFASHFRFASCSTKFDFSKTPLDVLPGLGGTIISQEELRRKDIIALILSGKSIQGEEAKKLGLIDYTAPADIIEGKARKFLTTLTEKRPPRLIRTIMESIHNGKKFSRKKALIQESILFNSVVRAKIAQYK